MTRKKLIEDIVLNPGRFYRNPVDVLRDRRFTDPERVRILNAWAEAVDDTDPAIRKQIDNSRNEISRKGALAEPVHSGPAD